MVGNYIGGLFRLCFRKMILFRQCYFVKVLLVKKS